MRNLVRNPAANKMVGKEELEKKADMSEPEKKKTRQSDSVNAILLQDILSSISSATVVLKLDIEGYECKVTFFLM